jgi:hypothetical protein
MPLESTTLSAQPVEQDIAQRAGARRDRRAQRTRLALLHVTDRRGELAVGVIGKRRAEHDLAARAVLLLRAPLLLQGLDLEVELLRLAHRVVPLLLLVVGERA